MGAIASALPKSLPVDPGDEAVATVRVRNRGSIVDEFAFRVLGEPAAWTELDPPSLNLFPNTEGVVSLRFRPPRTASTAPGLVPYGLSVSSVEEPESTFAEEGSLVLGTFSQTFAEVFPRTSRGRRQGKHDLAFDNHGNTKVKAQIGATDNENALVFDVNPPHLRAGPGKATFAKVRVRPRRHFLRGPDRMYHFQLVVQPDGSEPSALDGLMIQRPLLPRLLFPAAVVLAVLAVVWATVLKPEIQSTAKNQQAVQVQQRAQAALNKSAAATQQAGAAAAQAKSAGTAAQQAVSQATAAGNKASAADTAAAAAGKQASQSAAVAQATAAQVAQLAAGGLPGQPTGLRLTVTCPPKCAVKFKAPKGHTISITDVVFGNPRGDSGIVSLTRNGQPLLVESLDNFRNLDFNFISPIVLGAGQKVALTVQCANPKPSAGGKAKAPPCTSSAYLAAFDEQTAPPAAAKGTATQQAAVPPLPSRGTPTGQRLALRCPPKCAVKLTVPKDQTLSITDVVFGDPLGDSGILRLTRNGQPLLVESLDGFHDLDLRFTAPIVVAAGQKLALTVECGNPKPAAGGKAAPCTPAAYVAGFSQKVQKPAAKKAG